MVLDECNLCGLCKSVCPIFKITLKETVGPRGKAILIKKDMLDKIYYICLNCNACEKICPSGVKLKILKMRQLLVENKIETKANKEIIENLRNTGNPFGIKE